MTWTHDTAGTILFSCGDAAFSAAHVLAAAAEWGALAPLREQSRARLASLARAQADHWEIDDALLQERSEAFRRYYDLRSVQATESWMNARGVTVDDFAEFLEREASHERDTEEDTAAPAIAIDDAAVDAALWPDAVFSGQSDTWCRKLSAWVAVARERGGPEAIAAEAADWSATLDRFARHYEDHRTAVSPEDRLLNTLRNRWSDFFRFQIEAGGFQSEAAAREACLCVQEDGAALDAVCAMAHGEYATHEILLSQLPEDFHTQAISASPGTILGPVDTADGHWIYLVRQKEEPSLHDAATRTIISDDLMEESVRPLVQQHIVWAGH